ncbi:MAG: METTL5 family protein [Candidatus Woesearchaeota archaeon]
MSQKHLARLLQKLKEFEKPKIKLEQYTTNADVAAELLWSLNLRGHIQNKTIIDLGAGTGTLGIGSLLLGAKKVIFLEKDEDAIKTLKENLEQLEKEYELPKYEIISSDVTNAEGEFDLAIMNPPFGTKIKKIDTLFIDIATKLTKNILSIHKTITKEHIQKTYLEHNYKIIDIFNFKYSLKKTQDHHEKKVKIIEVSAFFTQKNNKIN